MAVKREAESLPALNALGLMSGTSLDGVDAAFLRTDGARLVEPGLWRTFPYDGETRDRLRRALSGADIPEAERAVTEAHAQAALALIREAEFEPRDVDLIGFPGHTVAHRPDQGITRQIGDGARLADRTGIDVISDFRRPDLAAGGEGAPLAPLYHLALARDLARPLAVLNVGGIANVTWIGLNDRLIAFDTGPGSALIDDWALRHTGKPFDRDGALARAGRVDQKALEDFLAHPYFERPPAKSLDRDSFGLDGVEGLSPADGAATLTAFTARAAARAVRYFPVQPKRWLISGGGRRNGALMDRLREEIADAEVAPVEAVGWEGDALEAQAFAYLAVRSLRGLALSLPETTGVSVPTTGGTLHRPRSASG